ncbi:MAG: LysM peptidoglycan-binding domain-containing protein [Candidatus Sungbacteria bacterium]|uniref:LysM peptidoglycan-binding domain-containing protein n=1 Tax=Candidatus Sungiibacteriota bacterium TaxID=2750080 RepID=A0A9D6LMV7_9BACT|nr:LysM peptidoglycan-binding domain-containing protein [Candidatus Sungbacteria bacterium]
MKSPILRPASAGILLVLILIGALAVRADAAQAGFISELIKFFTNAAATPAGKADFINETKAASNAAPVLYAIPNPEAAKMNLSQLPDLAFIQNDSLVAPANPLGSIQDQDNAGRIFVYTVKPGDTPSAIAKSFSISVNTILVANNLKNASSIKIGDQLVILPISGVTYVVKKGDTIESIAKKYNQTASDILSYNNLPIGGTLDPGIELIIPDGELNVESLPSPGASERFASLPNLKGYFIRPIGGGIKTQGIHGNNGVDLANSCGTPIMAAADGVVLLARINGYNSGFGDYIVIDHANGTQTVYAHIGKSMVTPGENVTAGQIIALIGNTGNTKGSTGCHVHFEIHGARNPF